MDFSNTNANDFATPMQRVSSDHQHLATGSGSRRASAVHGDEAAGRAVANFARKAEEVDALISERRARIDRAHREALELQAQATSFEQPAAAAEVRRLRTDLAKAQATVEAKDAEGQRLRDALTTAAQPRLLAERDVNSEVAATEAAAEGIIKSAHGGFFAAVKRVADQCNSGQGAQAKITALERRLAISRERRADLNAAITARRERLASRLAAATATRPAEAAAKEARAEALANTAAPTVHEAPTMRHRVDDATAALASAVAELSAAQKAATDGSAAKQQVGEEVRTRMNASKLAVRNREAELAAARKDYEEVAQAIGFAPRCQRCGGALQSGTSAA